MSSLQPTPVARPALAWIRDVITPEPAALAAVRSRCEDERLPVIGADTGATLAALAGTHPGGRALEVGCLHGYSAMWLARGLGANGTVDTIERDPDFADQAEMNWRSADLGDRITVHRGEAADVLPALDGPYDVVFIDADKAGYPAYLDHALRVTRPGSVIAADNVFWHGSVWQEDAALDDDLQGVRRFIARLRDADDLVTTVVPVGDGLSVSVVR